MNLYVLHNDPAGCGPIEDRRYAAVWAEAIEEAIATAEPVLGPVVGDAPEPYACDQASPGLIDPPAEAVQVERRPEVLRLLGFWLPGEIACCNCGLYPMDLPEHALCPGCDHCPDCECACALDLATDPEEGDDDPESK